MIALARPVFVELYTEQPLNMVFIRQSQAKYNKSEEKNTFRDKGS